MRLPRLSLRWWLLGSHAMVLALPVVVVVGTGILGAELRKQTEADLQNQAALVGLLVRDHVAWARQANPHASLTDIGPGLTPSLIAARTSTLAGIRVVDHHGVVVASSGDELGEDLRDRAEVAEALEGAVALEVRERPTPTQNAISSSSRRALVRVFLGAPLVYDGATIGAVVLSRTPREEVQALYQALPWWAVLLPSMLTVLIALVASRAGTRSLRRLALASHRLALGDLSADVDLARPAASRVVEVGELAEAMGTMTDRLRDRLAYNAEVAAHVSHEFKTPIATLRGTSELLRDDPEMPAQQRDRFLDNALAELDRLERLVTGLLDLARAEERPSRAMVDLEALARDVAARFEGVQVGGPGVPLAVPGVASQLDVALANLVANACQYGAPPVNIVVSGRGGRACVSVIDHGQGIKPGNRDRLFERFFTTSRADGGTGLGLALVKTVAEAHGGGVEVDSRPGRTAFTMCVARPSGQTR